MKISVLLKDEAGEIRRPSKHKGVPGIRAYRKLRQRNEVRHERVVQVHRELERGIAAHDGSVVGPAGKLVARGCRRSHSDIYAVRVETRAGGATAVQRLADDVHRAVRWQHLIGIEDGECGGMLQRRLVGPVDTHLRSEK